ncbi:MAG: hypothetical protein V4498_08955 [candidate division FCPU426 bacterium]
MKPHFIFFLLICFVTYVAPKTGFSKDMAPQADKTSAPTAPAEVSSSQAELKTQEVAKLDSAETAALKSLESKNPELVDQKAGDERVDVYHHYDGPSRPFNFTWAGLIIGVGLIALLLIVVPFSR